MLSEPTEGFSLNLSPFFFQMFSTTDALSESGPCARLCAQPAMKVTHCRTATESIRRVLLQKPKLDSRQQHRKPHLS